MKKILKFGGIGLAALVALFFIVALFLPREFQVTRTAVIHAPPAHVFGLVEDLRHLTAWSPWKAADPTMELTFSDDPKGVGAWYSWTSENSGRGKMTLVECEPPRLIRSALDFDGGKMAATAVFTFEPVAEGTRVSWLIEGDDGGHLPHRYFAAIMDSMVGPSCVDGLSRLKKLAESTAPAPAGTPE